jgi:molybdopterin-guanine dinucleotide biosynthesis protein A
VEHIGGYVLVGGRSKRFGQDKALLEIEGKPMALRAAAALQPVTATVTLVGSPEKYTRLGLRVISDPSEDVGPLAGLLAALEDTLHAWNLVTACDMPFLRSEFLAFLVQQAQQRRADVLLPLGPEGLPEPLCAAYSRGCRHEIRRQVERGTRKVTRAFENLRVEEVPANDYARFDPDGRLFTNLNRVADLETAGLEG